MRWQKDNGRWGVMKGDSSIACVSAVAWPGACRLIINQLRCGRPYGDVLPRYGSVRFGSFAFVAIGDFAPRNVYGMTNASYQIGLLLAARKWIEK